MQERRAKISTTELVTIESFKPDIQMPERKNQYSEAKYDKIDKVCRSEVVITQSGVTYVSEDAMPTLLEKNKKDADFIYEQQLLKGDKIEEGGKSYAHSSAVLGLLDKKRQETRGSGKRDRLRYGQENIYKISNSSEAEQKRSYHDDHDAKELLKLKDRREALRPPEEKGMCEITKQPLQKGAAFHHNEFKGIETNPEKRLDPKAGVNINPEPHAEIHKRRLYGTEGVEQLKKEYEERNNTSA